MVEKSLFLYGSELLILYQFKKNSKKFPKNIRLFFKLLKKKKKKLHQKSCQPVQNGPVHLKKPTGPFWTGLGRFKKIGMVGRCVYLI